jgi:hypothetical protein
MSIDIKLKNVPDQEWKWNESGTDVTGVKVAKNKLIWYQKTGNNLKEIPQTFEDFMKDGPVFESIPAAAMVEIYEMMF